MGKLTGIIQYSGKLSNSVGMRGQNGRNYIRLRRTEIKNPKSDAQCIQRMILATVAISIAFLKEICDNSVEGKRNGSETLAYLRGQWMRMLRVDGILESPFNYAKKGSNFFIVNPYLLSKGSLAAPAVSVLGDSGALLCSELAVDVQHASEAFPSVALGNQITIVAVALDDTGVETRPVVKYCRFAFKNDAVAPFVRDTEGSYRLNPLAIDVAKAEGDWQLLIFDLERIFVDDFCGGYNYIAAGAIIVSNLVDKKRSTSYLTLADGLAKQWSAADAYPTYGDQVVSYDMVSDEYLNNSTNPVANTSGQQIESMDFSLPIGTTNLEGKKITMTTNVSLADCQQHLHATTVETSVRLYVNAEGYLTDGEDTFNSVSCSGREITFGAASNGPSITAFVWE